MSAFWRAFFGAALGKTVVTLVLALCVVLGFGGPTDWMAFVITGMPDFVTPGTARLSLLLAASLGIFLEWRVPVDTKIREWGTRTRRVVKTTFLIACSLPFVFGAFYVTANSTRHSARHLSHKNKAILALELKKIPSDQLPFIAVASVEEPNAIRYAMEFINFFDYYGFPVDKVYGDPPENRILMPYSVREFGWETGLSISVHDKGTPPDTAKVFYAALQRAGLRVDYETFYGRMPTKADFMLTIRY
jgi:hypothetical protein